MHILSILLNVNINEAYNKVVIDGVIDFNPIVSARGILQGAKSNATTLLVQVRIYTILYRNQYHLTRPGQFKLWLCAPSFNN